MSVIGHWSWSLELHRKLLGDGVRNGTFHEAFKKIIRRGETTVVDIGAGTGFLSFLASRLGAKRCILYECDQSVSALSEEIAKRNGIRNCSFHSIHTSEVKKPIEKADVVVSETLGSFALEENLLENMKSARRFLRDRENSLLVPYRLRQFIAPLSGDQCFREVNVWDHVGHGLDFSDAKAVSLSHLFQRSISVDQIWRPGPSSVCWDELDFYRETNDSMRLSKPILWQITERVTLFGFVLWWEADLVPGVMLSTSPFEPSTHWQQVYMPMREPLHLEKGDCLRVAIQSESSYQTGIDILWSIVIQRGPIIVKSIQSKPPPIVRYK